LTRENQHWPNFQVISTKHTMAEQTVQHIRLSELTGKIREIIEQNFDGLSFWIVADVTNHNFKEKSNYHYFDLVEKAEESNELISKISGKAWGNGSLKIKQFERITGQHFTNNINVLVNVRVSHHVVYGLSLDILDIDPNFTIGVLEQQRQATLARLVEENSDVVAKIGDRYVSRNSKLPLPLVIQRIAVISSKTSAGNEDFRHTLVNNPYGYRFEIHDYHTIVQNEAYAQQFIQSMIDVYNSRIPYDVVVINRGGGAQTDFLIFDNYKIGLAVARFPIPIITGIGHQKNETIADLMAHTQTKTPTKAAEFIITHNKMFEDSLVHLQKTIIIKAQQTFSANFQQLATLNTSIINRARTSINRRKDELAEQNRIVTGRTSALLTDKRSELAFIASSLVSKPRIITGNRMNDLSNMFDNIVTFRTSFLRSHRSYLQHYVSVIRLMSPESILRKGFALVRKAGTITSDPSLFTPGTEMEVILSEKSIKSVVQSNEKYHGGEFDL
jgi:exodeoxyribonuclease VII large subunit